MNNHESIMHVLEECLSQEHYQKIIRCFGGETVHIPKYTVVTDSENKNVVFRDFYLTLGEFLSVEERENIIRNFSGQTLYIPKNGLLPGKYDQILRDYAAGIRVKAIARKYKYSESNVYRIIQRNKPFFDNKQITFH
jgi:Mor family transcriptional regulator